MGKQPPVPPANRNPHDSDIRPEADDTSGAGKKPMDPDKQGQQANTRQNTTHQGYQQDR